MTQRIAIVDYGMGNLHSVYRKTLHTNATVFISSNPNELATADKLILPGVGHFGKAMENLYERGLVNLLHEKVLQQQTPVLGICLGMQLMASMSEEGDAEGLGWIKALVKKFTVKDHLRYKVPHMGWNNLVVKKRSRLLQTISEQNEFYFLHSFHFAETEPGAVLTQTIYEYPFVSAVEKNNIFGVQFHPEKSHGVGYDLLKNFIES